MVVYKTCQTWLDVTSWLMPNSTRATGVEAPVHVQKQAGRIEAASDSLPARSQKGMQVVSRAEKLAKPPKAPKYGKRHMKAVKCLAPVAQNSPSKKRAAQRAAHAEAVKKNAAKKAAHLKKMRG